jgi:glycosyltransferase involved in cell wall biosynthesis
MKIAITGSRGIPNNYGGFEQCAENLAVLLVEFGHDVTVYNPDYHVYNEPKYHGVNIVKQWNPEKKIGTFGNFIYDYKCMQHAIKNQADILLVLGYTTASIFFPILNKKKSILITNMDGLEWKRDKWNSIVKKIALWFESLGAKYSDYLVSDNREIRNYILSTYKKDSTFIAYGATLFSNPDIQILDQYNVSEGNYDMLVARLEKENNIETALDGVVKSNSKFPMLIIGNYKTPYGLELVEKYKPYKNILFLGGVYNQDHLNNLRWFARVYFHGHSVGGTNPSLLEAMASNAFIVAHNNLFNRDVLGNNAHYFSSSNEVAELLNNETNMKAHRAEFIEANRNKIKNEFNWEKIASEYEELFKTVLTLQSNK